jgi:hypothetical protein
VLGPWYSVDGLGYRDREASGTGRARSRHLRPRVMRRAGLGHRLHGPGSAVLLGATALAFSVGKSDEKHLEPAMNKPRIVTAADRPTVSRLRSLALEVDRRIAASLRLASLPAMRVLLVVLFI